MIHTAGETRLATSSVAAGINQAVSQLSIIQFNIVYSPNKGYLILKKNNN